MGTVKRRSRKRGHDIDPDLMAMLQDEAPENSFSRFAYSEAELLAAWRENGSAVLAKWIEDFPGTRPSYWWRYDAPRGNPGRFLGTIWAELMIESRRLLKGKGRPAWERFCYTPSFSYGIPECWVEGDVGALVFESQYDYLKRHGLLERDEGRSAEPLFVPRQADNG